MTGKFLITYANGDKFEGEYKNNKRNGKGTFSSRDGSSGYVGEYKNGERNGYGVEKRSDGAKYDGPWKDGNPHGKGVMTSPAGLKLTVIYDNGNITQMLK